MKLPFPILWLALVAMWLVLNGTLALGHVIIAMLVAFGGVLGVRALYEPVKTRRPIVAIELAAVVLMDIVHSNIAVAKVVLLPNPRRRPGFVEIPLDLRVPAALAVLACIVTATPGTSWAGYDARSGVLTLHILDLVEDDEWIHTIKGRYERRLLEIFQ